MPLFKSLLSGLTKKASPPQCPVKENSCHIQSGSASESDDFIFDPFARSFIDDPYPALSILRQNYPVYRCSNGSWVLSRHEDISTALKDPRLGNSPSPYAVVSERNRHKYVCADVAQNILPYMDAPAHTQVRKLIARSFHQHLNDNPLDIGARCHELLLTRSSDSIDLLAEFATPLCFRVVTHLFGVNPETSLQLQARYKSWSEWFFYLFSIIPSEEVLKKTNNELLQCRDYFRQLIDQRRATPGNDWLSGMLHENQQIVLNDTQLIDTCMLIMADAINADFGIANAFLALLQNSRLQDELRAGPQHTMAAANELLRFDSPSLFIARRAVEDIEIRGRTIGKNSGVLLMLASANRDESVFSSADQIKIDRESNPYLSFGRGEHACIGRQLVVRMVDAAINVLLTQTGSIELLLDRPEWELRAGHRWLKSLPVRLH